MTLTSLLLLTLFATGAAFVQRTTGFGFGIFIMTWLPYLLPSYGEATTLSGLLAMVTSALLTIKYRRQIAWRRLLPILITFLLVSGCAVFLLTHLHTATLKRTLGVTLILVSLYFWFLGDKVDVKPNKRTQISLGTLSGFMGGMFGMQGPPAVLYFLKVSPTKDAYTAIAQAYFLIGNVVMTFYRAYSGFLTKEVGISWCCAIPAVFLGTWIGGLVFKRISLPLLKKIVYAFIGISGVVSLVC